MKATEVRIGNYVYNTKGEVDKVNVSALEYLLLEGDKSTCQVKPIPLTEDMLKKCGFKQDNYNGYFYMDICDTIFYLRTGFVGGFYWGFIDSMNDEYSELSDANSIFYLHQLQNLYFVLTGEELTITL